MTEYRTTDVPDYLNKTGAYILAARLTAFWRDRGYHSVAFWPESVNVRLDKMGTYEIYRVVSNLVNGLPPKDATQQRAA